jgi:6-pyruvoyltetrahydropterin/6-carboxytetrahydropterin synthase
MELTREVRFSLGGDDPPGGVNNSWGGWPASCGIVPFVVLRITVSGEVDRRTGFLCNIILLDRAVREVVVPRLSERWRLHAAKPLPVEILLADFAPLLESSLPGGVRLSRLELRVTPSLAYTWHAEKERMVSLTQVFEFAAAHRLYCADFSEDENRKIFGKCTNPNGHGHNYLVEVTVQGQPDARSGLLLQIGEFEQIVKRRVIDVFDHKHLNSDCPEFAQLNPSVENITRIIWEKLEGAFGRTTLARVRVYETPKTVAEYAGPEA